MKKLFCLLLAFVMLLSFAACEKDDKDEKEKKEKTPSYEQPVKDMIDIQVGKATEKQIKRMYPEEVLEMWEEDADELWEEYEDEKEYIVEEYEDQYGKNFKITYKITDKEELKGGNLDELADELNYQFDIDMDDVEEAYELEIEFTLKGNDDEDEYEKTVTVYKLRGQWYLHGPYKQQKRGA